MGDRCPECQTPNYDDGTFDKMLKTRFEGYYPFIGVSDIGLPTWFSCCTVCETGFKGGRIEAELRRGSSFFDKLKAVGQEWKGGTIPVPLTYGR